MVLLADCSAAAGKPRATATPNSGNLDGGYPELSIVLPEPDAIEVSLEDPNARAWLLTIAGAGDGGAAGGSDGALPVCISSDGVTFGADGSGIVSITLELPESAPLVITGVTAGWPGDPFVLGPWIQTEPFDRPQD